MLCLNHVRGNEYGKEERINLIANGGADRIAQWKA